VELQETVAVPRPGRLVGLMVPQVRPDGGVSVRLTVLENPFKLATVIVNVTGVWTLAAAGGLAVMV
jgi:hypothetical protein